MMTKLPPTERPISTARTAVYLANGTFKNEIKCCHGTRVQFLRPRSDGCYGGNKILAVLEGRPIKLALAFYASTREISHFSCAQLSVRDIVTLLVLTRGLK